MVRSSQSFLQNLISNGIVRVGGFRRSLGILHSEFESDGGKCPFESDQGKDDQR